MRKPSFLGVILMVALVMGDCFGAESEGLAEPMESASSNEATWLAQAEAGDVEAQFQLATLYDKGEFETEDNLASAFFWYEKAALQGHPVACYNLGNAYKHGRGAVQSESLANYWWQKSADAGLASAQFNLALQYFRGLGVDKDPDKAVLLINQAAANGHEKAKALIDTNRIPKVDLTSPPAQENPGIGAESSQIVADGEEKPETNWLASRNPGHFCIQLAVMANPDNIREFQRQYHLEKSTNVVEITRGGQPYHYLLLGEFIDRQAASAALGTLPRDLLRHKPWPRPFGQLQALSGASPESVRVPP